MHSTHMVLVHFQMESVQRVSSKTEIWCLSFSDPHTHTHVCTHTHTKTEDLWPVISETASVFSALSGASIFLPQQHPITCQLLTYDLCYRAGDRGGYSAYQRGTGWSTNHRVERLWFASRQRDINKACNLYGNTSD